MGQGVLNYEFTFGPTVSNIINVLQPVVNGQRVQRVPRVQSVQRFKLELELEQSIRRQTLNQYLEHNITSSKNFFVEALLP